MTLRYRRAGKTRVIAGLLHGLTLVPVWLTKPRHSQAARRHEHQFMARIARRLVDEIRVTGAEPGGRGTLYIANHISWMDIPVLGSALDIDFVAKTEVRHWPLIGPLARRSGTLFVDREARHRVHEQADGIGARLRAGHSLILFAEGTTSDGIAILPFRSSLFEAAQHAACIQPLAIGYHHDNGGALTDVEMQAIGWIEDETLAANFKRVAPLRLSAEIRLMPRFAPEPGITRKALAERCRQAVVEAYAAIRGAKN